MAYLGNVLNKVDFSKIATMYAFSVALSQIISYASSTLVFEGSKLDRFDTSRSYLEKQEQATALCLRWWAILTAFVVVALILAQGFLLSQFFNSKIDGFVFYAGLLWMCGMSLEALSVNISVKSGKMLPLLFGGIFQLTLLMVTVPFAISNLGVHGLISCAAISYVCGCYVILNTFDLRKIFGEKSRTNKALLGVKLLKSILPSAVAAISVASLNSILLAFVIRTPNSAETIGTFTLSMQLFSLFNFLPQTSVSFAASKMEDRPTGRTWTIIEGLLFSLLFSLSAAIILIFIGQKITMVLYSNYTWNADLFGLIALLLLTASLGQLLSHCYVLSNLQVYIATASVIASCLSVSYFFFESRFDSHSMLLATVLYNLTRNIIFSIGYTKITK